MESGDNDNQKNETGKEKEKRETIKMILGLAVVVGIIILSYVFFPFRPSPENRGFDFQQEINNLQQQISDIKVDVPEPAATSTTSTDSNGFIINGPGGCSTLDECQQYCSQPENLAECQEYFSR